ncbi:MAG: hypothetical protein LBL00_07925 [Endomicrobium sp.]|jgi:hypothetical protein|nr:hypothetical protein [Endomicrobium sp.]
MRNKLSANEKKQENILIKIYILALFLCGIGLWFAVNAAPKQKMSIDIELEHKIVNALAANGIKQTDIISQYTRERETSAKSWNEFYKKVRLQGNKRSDHFENSLRAVARSMKLGLSKTENVDATVTYKFYSSGMNYSNITFVNPKKTVSSSKQSKPAASAPKEKTISSQTKTSPSKTKTDLSKTKTQAKAKK